MKIPSLLLIIFTIVTCAVQVQAKSRDLTPEEDFQKQVDSIKNRMTPFIGKDVLNYTKTPQMILGFTFDSVTRAVRLPIIDNNASPITNQSQIEERTFSYSFNSINDYLDKMASLESDEYPFVNGLFSNQQDIVDFFKGYFSKDFMLTVSQKEYTYWKKTVNPGQVVFTDEFLKIVNQILPDEYDERLYSMFIKEFGTHVSYDARFGGLIDAQIFIKDCTWGLIDEKTVEEESIKDVEFKIKNTSKNRTDGNHEYIQHREIHTMDIAGGNPLIECKKDCNDRIESFKENPVVTSFMYAQIPYFIDKEVVANNLKKAIGDYIDNQGRKQRDKDLETVKEEEQKKLNEPKSCVTSMAQDPNLQILRTVAQNDKVQFEIQRGTAKRVFQIERSDYYIRLSYWNRSGVQIFGSWGDKDHPSILSGVIFDGKTTEIDDLYAFYNCESVASDSNDLKCQCPVW